MGIIQENKNRCFLCGGSATEHLDRHHIFAGINRENSEKYGLVVYLHHNRCHIFGSRAVHRNSEQNKLLQAYAQEKAMEKYGWDIDEWIEIFGKDYR